MATEMSRRERVQAAVRGDQLDRVPWSLWRHFYERESTAEQLAEAMVAWQRRHGFDLLKVNPRAHYHVEDWGARYHYSGDPHQKPERLDYPVKSAEDWRRLQPNDPGQGALGEQLRALRQIRQQLGRDLVVVETVFLPLMVAEYLAESPEALRRDIEGDPGAVHQALGAIVETFSAFTARCLEAGVDGFFFATTWGVPSKLPPELYAEFGRPYDLQVIQAARQAGARTNVLHVCGDGARVFDFADYPAELVSYAATSPANPGLGETVGKLPGAVIGGLSAESVTDADPSRARADAERARTATGGRRWLLGGPCSLSTHARDETLRAAAQAVGIPAPAST